MVDNEVSKEERDEAEKNNWPISEDKATCVNCGDQHACYACGVVHYVEADNPNCNPDASGNPDCDLRENE